MSYIILGVCSILGGLLSISCVLQLAKIFVEGNRLKFFLLLIISFITIGFSYSFSQGLFYRIQEREINQKYQELIKEYEVISLNGLENIKTKIVQNYFLSGFLNKKTKENVCENMVSVLPQELRIIVETDSDYAGSNFEKQTQQICVLSQDFLKINEKESCATKENGFFCYLTNKLISKIITEKFQKRLLEVPSIIDEQIIDNPLNEYERLVS